MALQAQFHGPDHTDLKKRGVLSILVCYRLQTFEVVFYVRQMEDYSQSAGAAVVLTELLILLIRSQDAAAVCPGVCYYLFWRGHSECIEIE